VSAAATPEVLPLRQRANVAIALIAVSLVAALGSLWTDLDELSLANRGLDGERVALGERQDADDLAAGAGLAYTVVFVVSVVSFLLWYSRAYRNTIGLGIRAPRWGTRWAVWYWFIPIVLLFRPKQVVNDIWRGSSPGLQRPAPPGWVEGTVSPLIHWWWAAWLLASLLDQIAFRASIGDGGPRTLEEFHSEATAYVFADAADVIAAVFAILVVRAITTRLEERRRRAEAGELLESALPVPG